MKITRRQLRRLILQEVRIKPDAINIPPQHLDKIHSLIADGEFEQAQSFIDAFGGDPSYARNYMEYESVGDLEKLGNNTAGMFQKPPENPGFKPGYTSQDAQANQDLAMSISRKHAGQFEDPDDRLDAFDTHYYDRYIPNINKSSAANSDRFLEHRIKPSVTNIPLQHLDKIHDLIDAGELAQAQAFIDAFGGDPDYVDDYIEYQEVGDLEKLGNEAAAILSEPGYRYDDVQAVDDRARAIARDSMEDFEKQEDRLDSFYDSYYTRYAKNRNKEHLNAIPQHRDPDIFLEHKLLQEMAVRRILEIEMTDQYYLHAPELPGGKVAIGVEVEDLIDALYSFINKSYTHIVMADDLRDFNRDRSQFRYGIYTKIETAIKMLQIHRDPRRLYIQRS